MDVFAGEESSASCSQQPSVSTQVLCFIFISPTSSRIESVAEYHARVIDLDRASVSGAPGRLQSPQSIGLAEVNHFYIRYR